MAIGIDVKHVIRDCVLGVALALLLPLTAYLIMIVVFPEPTFSDFPCRYKNMSCVEADKYIANLKKQWEKENGQNEKTRLTQEIEAAASGLAKARQTRDQVLNKARDHVHKMQLFMGIVLGLVILLAGLFVAIVPLQVGLTLGGVFTVIFSYLHGWGVATNQLKLISLLIAIFIIIIAILKFHKGKR